MSIKLNAPAKLNLFLHVTGKRSDGYHLLDSIICFTDYNISDIIELSEIKSSKNKGEISFEISGEFANIIGDLKNNLVIKAAENFLRKYNLTSKSVAIKLEKNIPIGAGLGGGSSDAAAILKGLNQFFDIGANKKDLAQLGLALGADVPMFIYDDSFLRISGIGEIIEPVRLPKMAALIIYPQIFISSAGIYKSGIKTYSGNATKLVKFSKAQELATYLESCTNDLYENARKQSGIIKEVIELIAIQEYCLYSAMSGSGSACFGLFANINDAKNAAEKISAKHPEWWVKSTNL